MLQQTEWLVGLAFVVLYAHWRFTTPKTNRTSTTWSRFVCADIAYVGSSIALYIIASGLITSSPKMVKLLVDVKLPDDVASGPLAAALLLTTLLPNSKPLARFDQALLKWFQRLGRIPYEVLRWSQQLRRAELTIDAATQRELRDFIDRNQQLGWISDRDLQFDNSNAPAALFTRQLVLYQKVSAWNEDANYAGFVAEFDEEFDRLATRFFELASIASK